MYSMFHHPEVLGLPNYAEKIRDNGMGRGMVKNYVPIMKSMAEACEWRHREFNHLNLPVAGGPKIIADRTHIPFGQDFWKKLDGSGFKIISLIRDPREVALSVVRWHGMEKRNPNNTPKPQYVKGFMNLWHQSIKAHNFLQKNNDAIIIRHEDVCAKPKQEARKLFNWLGVSAEEQHLQHFVDAYEDPANRSATDNEYVKYLTPQVKMAARKLGYDV